MLPRLPPPPPPIEPPPSVTTEAPSLMIHGESISPPGLNTSNEDMISDIQSIQNILRNVIETEINQNMERIENLEQNLPQHENQDNNDEADEFEENHVDDPEPSSNDNMEVESVPLENMEVESVSSEIEENHVEPEPFSNDNMEVESVQSENAIQNPPSPGQVFPITQGNIIQPINNPQQNHLVRNFFRSIYTNQLNLLIGMGYNENAVLDSLILNNGDINETIDFLN